MAGKIPQIPPRKLGKECIPGPPQTPPRKLGKVCIPGPLPKKKR
jgi:hypothetical protein